MGTISDKFTYLGETKRKIGNAIIAKGGTVDDNDTFRSYADKINALELSEDINVTSLDVSSNGTYNAGTGGAYNPITVNVEPDLTTLDISSNGTYNASEDGADGYSRVTVNVQVGKTTTKTITLNGTYNASDEGFDGFSSIVVNVPGGASADNGSGETGTFTVWFNNGNKLLQTVYNVPYGGRAAYTGETPTQSGSSFVGWDPEPKYITADTVCYAVFTETLLDDKEIVDSWEDIVKNGGAKYEIGEYKHIETQWGVIRMQKVYGEDKDSTSTWIAMEAFEINPNGADGKEYFDTTTSSWYWPSCQLRKWLNSTFFDSLSDTLRDGIKSTVRYTKSRSGIEVTNATTKDLIWIPSLQEIYGEENSKTLAHPGCETMGKYYSEIFKDANSRKRLDGYKGIKYCDYFLRSFYYMDTTYGTPGYPKGCGVDTSGNIIACSPNESSKRLLIGFCL